MLYDSTVHGENMEILGLSDPWIIGGYALSIICVVFCCAYALIKGRGGSEEESHPQEKD